MTPAESRDLTSAVEALSSQLGETARLMVVAERERVCSEFEAIIRQVASRRLLLMDGEQHFRAELRRIREGSL